MLMSPFLDSEIVWLACRPHWTMHNRQCMETREGRVRAAQSSENCWHRRWQLVKVLHHLVRTLYGDRCGGCSSGPKQKLDWAALCSPHTGCGTGCDRPGQRGSSQCWCVVLEPSCSNSFLHCSRWPSFCAELVRWMCGWCDVSIE